MAQTGGDKVSKAERIEIVRRLLVMGKPDWRIRRLIVAGIKLKDGRTFQATNATAQKYLDNVGLEYQQLADHPLVAERVVGCAVERLVRIADKAEAAGNYQAAIRANKTLIDVVGIRHAERWGRKGVDAPVEVEAPGVDDYVGMTDDELRDGLERKVLRFQARADGKASSGGS